MDRTSVTPTPHQLRALTHPVRMRMLGMLRVEGPATATSLAQRLGVNTGATSYHLRQLAEHGFIAEDEGRGTGRERWWRATHTFTRTTTPPGDDLEARDADDAFLQSVATVHAEQVQRAVEERPLLSQEWRAVGTLSDWIHRLTPAQAARLVERLEEVVEEVGIEEHEEGADGALLFAVQLNAFPWPGQATVDPAAAEGDGT